MNKDEIIALLQQQNSLLQQQIAFLQEQLQEANRKADALLEEVTSLRNSTLAFVLYAASPPFK